jgi:hypothetical protein
MGHGTVKGKPWQGGLLIGSTVTRRNAKSSVAVHVHAVEMLVALLREFARRTAQGHRGNLQSAHSQLRFINSIAREMLVATKGSTGRTAVRVRWPAGDACSPLK